MFYYVKIPFDIRNRVLSQHKNNKHSVKHAANLKKKHSVYIKLGLTLRSLTALTIGKLLLKANSPNLSYLTIWRVTVYSNSPKFGFRYNSDS